MISKGIFEVYLPLVVADCLCDQHLPRNILLCPVCCILLLVQLTWHSHAKLQFTCDLP